MVEFKRRVVCDCCGTDITDLFGGYVIKCLGSGTYDLCQSCQVMINSKILNFEAYLVRDMFEHKEGRPVEDE